MKSFTLAALTATACRAISLEAQVEEAGDEPTIFYDESTHQWMEKSTEVSTITPTYEPSTSSWGYQDDNGNTITIDPVHGPPVPKFDYGTCEWIDEVSGQAFILAVNGD